MTRILPDGISKITGRLFSHRGYQTDADRERAIKQLQRRGFNHFVCYRDVASDYALAATWSEWAVGRPYVCR